MPNKYEEELNNLFEKVLNDEIPLGELAKEVGNLTISTSSDPLRAIDLMILSKGYQVNKNIKIMTWFIAGVTVLNLIVVAISVYLQFFL